ncbi:MAG: tyrosine--tRNA ligase [Pelagibacteraceae bacterium]|jgi:tyrosyl-tRNA synthetase|nr:tyrosine--tRNA ligase [Pelagibacteraceae bacterium]MDP6784322.1 tyrosine--tRNA ligase [Alphaproteobacteria bacterium]MBO6465957.1 tyrosine--tRNA ligase [Pelagibacteraceae bacterium]MBO6467333.1 tyrosine--tRNA ligase [Pelagibacteraceae bacterium]MBO6468595.1 tyrosine--tRNA ligase [Pelagibacteraceae bacterium]
MFKSNFLNEISTRGFIYQSSDIEDLDTLMNQKAITAYIGFDITSDSLHIGSLLQLMLLHWLDYYDHKTIALIGGGTTLIGDPSGKDEGRKILQLQDIENNIVKIEKIFEKFINLKDKAKIINNYEWLSDINYINFLRDVGSRVTINKMLTFESVKNRLDREQPLTFLEFNYMLLQAYDYYHLNKEYDCELQLGGSDQWGNIVSGIDLIRRLNNKKTFAITSPLITNNDGSKMGKTADGAIWLDECKLSNYDFYQFWRNADDTDVPKFLHFFTKLPLEEISKLSKLKGQEINEAKKILAFEVTKITRGEEQAREAKEISNNVFANNTLDDRINSFCVSSKEILISSFSLLDAVEKLQLVKSRSETKRLIKSNGIKVNDENYHNNDFSLSSYISKNEIKISVGKKKIGIIKII